MGCSASPHRRRSAGTSLGCGPLRCPFSSGLNISGNRTPLSGALLPLCTFCTQLSSGLFCGKGDKPWRDSCEVTLRGTRRWSCASLLSAAPVWCFPSAPLDGSLKRRGTFCRSTWGSSSFVESGSVGCFVSHEPLDRLGSPRLSPLTSCRVTGVAALYQVSQRSMRENVSRGITLS